MEAETTATVNGSPLSREQLRALQRRSNRRGLIQWAIHLGAIGAAGWIYQAVLARQSAPPLVAIATIGFGFTLVTMFAAMHESVHRTAFRTAWLNDVVGWIAGVLSFYNSTFYRPYHGWHHRFTQLPGRDPELEDRKPTNLATYLVELSGLPWWKGKVRTYVKIAFGRVESYGFLGPKTAPGVIRSVRWQLGVYGAAVGVSLALGRPLFLTYWLLPVALAQPLLRAILLAEHTGCSNDDNPLANTRTTHTILPVRLLMWNMPFHAEHHRYPAMPFFALAHAHQHLGPRLVHVARSGYLGLHLAFLARFWRSFARKMSKGPPADINNTKRGHD